MLKSVQDILLKKASNYLGDIQGKKIAVLVSGGVDSSVALALLKHFGADVKAYYLKIWLEDEVRFLGGDCPWEDDMKFVEGVCDDIGCEFEIVPLQKEYFDKVVSYTINEVKRGRTPNPDVMCNSRIKFGAFVDYMEDKEYDLIASGHYAWKSDKGQEMKLAPDNIKDQTYFLSYLKDEQIENLIFPIGCFEKNEVRELAESFDLINKNRKDSQGICFLGKLKFRDFIEHYLGVKKGKIVDFDTGEEIGEHDGFYFYTRGQRKGIGLGGGPWYVVKKDVEKNIVFVSREYFEDDKVRNTLVVDEFNWLTKEPSLDELKECTVKLRHGEKRYGLESVERVANGLKLQIDEDDQGIASGQFVVFYKDDLCLGAGVIQ